MSATASTVTEVDSAEGTATVEEASQVSDPCSLSSVVVPTSTLHVFETVTETVRETVLETTTQTATISAAAQETPVSVEESAEAEVAHHEQNTVTEGAHHQQEAKLPGTADRVVDGPEQVTADDNENEAEAEAATETAA
ncbi:hypothetical protein O9K51_07262 [Purpureocillium lavendulum]|uniref:Uncharacterized protein n=1 Tax=Purpureocillium lavendulum TaxID=1247861 RepID=A0AB34FJX1_9HYPO|nr:hypothetical protein O9K51_07262 [Purpureocillium lavendulum]